MKFLKEQFLLLFGILFYGKCFSQTTYIDNWFSNNCNYCVSLDTVKKKKELNLALSPWHNAHVAFTNKDYKKANYYLLQDKYTKEELKTIFKGHLALRLGLYDNAEKYFKDSLLIKSEAGNISQIIFKSLGQLYNNKKDYDSAILYYKKVEANNNLPAKLKNEVKESLAGISLIKREFVNAETSYKDLLKIYNKSNDSLSLSRVYANLGNLYFEQYKDELAKRYFDSAYVLAKPSKDLPLRSFITYNLYIVSEAMKKHEQAVLYLKEYTVLQDSIQKENTVWQVAQQKEDFNIAKKEAEIERKTAQRNLFLFFFSFRCFCSRFLSFCWSFFFCLCFCCLFCRFL